MSKQQFSSRFREALWDVHDHRCIYCTESVLFMNMEIDHVVPEQLLSNLPMLARVKAEMGLASSFDVLGYENLAASCKDCNRKKGGCPFASGYGSIVLSKVGDKLPALLIAIDKKRQDQSLDGTLRCIARSFDKKEFSREDLLEGIMNPQNYPSEISGAMPGGPISSPERREANISFYSAKQLSWTSGAKADILRYGYSADRLSNLMYYAAIDGSLMAKRVRLASASTYTVKVGVNFRIVFVISEDRVQVISVVLKRST